MNHSLKTGSFLQLIFLLSIFQISALKTLRTMLKRILQIMMEQEEAGTSPFMPDMQEWGWANYWRIFVYMGIDVDESDTSLGSGGMCTPSHAFMEDILKWEQIIVPIYEQMESVDGLLERSEDPMVV